MSRFRLVLLVLASCIAVLLIVVAWYNPARGYAIGQVLMGISAVAALGIAWWRDNERDA
jgi:hypothetical protein